MVKKLLRKLDAIKSKYVRVWRLLKKPSTEEFKTISKVSAIGIMIIGAVGFVISVTMKMLF